MALNGNLSKNTNINIRSKYVLHQNGPLLHELLPYKAPPVFPKAPRHVRKQGVHRRENDTESEDGGDSYRSIYRNWPQQIDDEIDDMYLPIHSNSDEPTTSLENPIVDGALALAGDDDGYFIIRKSHYPQLQQLSNERRATDAEDKRKAAVDAALSRCPSRQRYDNSAEHLEFVDKRVKRFVDESERQTAELLACTRVNTQRESEERDDKNKRIRHRLFLRRNSPFSAAQSLVVSRLEEKLYATAPIDLLSQKYRTRCQYSNLPVIRHLNDLAIADEQQLEQTKGLIGSSVQLAEARRRREESQSRAAMGDMSVDLQRAIRGKSATAIGAALYAESMKKIKDSRNVQEATGQECNVRCEARRQLHSSRALKASQNLGYDSEEEYATTTSFAERRSRAASEHRTMRTIHLELMDDRAIDQMNHNVHNSLEACRYQLKNFSHTSSDLHAASSKQTAIEIEQLNARLVEAETKLKTEVLRIKKKLQITITELEMSLDVANKTNIDLQKTIKKQSLQLTEIQAHYDDIQRQLQQTLDQYAVAQRRIASLSGECEEIRGNYESALRGKKAVEIAYEEAGTKITELSSINVSLNSMRSKLEAELSTIANDYEEVSRELRASDERYQKVQVELKSTIELLHDEQERIVKIETIKKSLEVEVKNLSIRLEEVEANAVVGAKRIISKMEARIRDLELELEEEKRRHAETIKILRKKERTVKEIVIQCEEDQKTALLLQETLDKANAKINIYKRQLNEQEGMSAQSVTRARRFQRELEAAEDRAEVAESNLNMVRAKHRTFVTSSTVPGGAVYVVESTRTITE